MRLLLTTLVALVLTIPVLGQGGPVLALGSGQQAVPVAIPGSADVSPGETITFADPFPNPPSGAAVPSSGGVRVIEVTNHSDQPATVSYDGHNAIIAVPDGLVVNVAGTAGMPIACTFNAGRPNVVTCPVRERQVQLTFWTAAV